MTKATFNNKFTFLNNMLQSVKVSLQSTEVTRIVRSDNNLVGILVAFAVIGIWATSLSFLLSLNISDVPILWILPAMMWQMFLYTGLFITAHDAMHGAVFPQNHKINNLVGSIVLLLYGLFSYKELLKKHWQHHHHPASDIDPDFHNSKHKNFFAWYFNFMVGYWSWIRLICLIILFEIISYTIHTPEKNLTLFWIIPSILSSAQLFYFGTFLPHREPEGGYKNVHRAETNPLPVFWSFITCYHFGYHEEHHEYPHVPWWQLPEVHEMQKELS